MAQNTTVTVPERTWTQLTNADATNVTFEAINGSILVKATTDATAPTDDLGAAWYHAGKGEANLPILELFPGVAGVRLWAYAYEQTKVLISHA